jgi:hypothetical protein
VLIFNFSRSLESLQHRDIPLVTQVRKDDTAIQCVKLTIGEPKGMDRWIYGPFFYLLQFDPHSIGATRRVSIH